jgi:hypothetical protein
MLNFSPGALLVGGMVSLVGMAAIAYGRKAGRLGAVIGGAILTVFPMFVASPLVMALGGAAVLAGIYFFPE